MNTYQGKEECINGVWYPVTIQAESYKEAIKKLYVGQKKPYGIVEQVRGRLFKVEQF